MFLPPFQGSILFNPTLGFRRSGSTLGYIPAPLRGSNINAGHLAAVWQTSGAVMGVLCLMVNFSEL